MARQRESNRGYNLRNAERIANEASDSGVFIRDDPLSTHSSLDNDRLYLASVLSYSTFRADVVIVDGPVLSAAIIVYDRQRGVFEPPRGSAESLLLAPTDHHTRSARKTLGRTR